MACVKAFFTVLDHVLMARGYRKEVQYASPDQPDLHIYVKNGERIAISMTHVASDKLAIRVEGPEESLRGAVRETAELLMSELQDILKMVS